MEEIHNMAYFNVIAILLEDLGWNINHIVYDTPYISPELSPQVYNPTSLKLYNCVHILMDFTETKKITNEESLIDYINVVFLLSQENTVATLQDHESEVLEFALK